MDPALFRWYAASMTQPEYFRFTPRTVFLYFGGIMLVMYMYTRICLTGNVSYRKLSRTHDSV